MPADKYMTLQNGRDTLVSATQTSAGAAQAGKIPALNDSGKLDVTLLPSDVLRDNVNLFTATEAIGAGKFVNIYNDGTGAFKARLADNSNDRRAMGFVKTAVANGAQATVYFGQDNTLLSGLVPGRVYLGTAGGVVQTPPVSPAAVISQFLGMAMSATELDVNIDDEVVL